MAEADIRLSFGFFVVFYSFGLCLRIDRIRAAHIMKVSFIVSLFLCAYIVLPPVFFKKLCISFLASFAKLMGLPGCLATALGLLAGTALSGESYQNLFDQDLNRTPRGSPEPANALPAPQPAAAPAAQQQNHPFGEGGEREARAQEHARISAEVETITNACENLEAAMVREAHILLRQRGITLEDPEDVKRALRLALHDDWEHDIDDRQRHFTVLRRDFGTARCDRWNPFIDELRGLGNSQVNARHYVD